MNETKYQVDINKEIFNLIYQKLNTLMKAYLFGFHSRWFKRFFPQNGNCRPIITHD